MPGADASPLSACKRAIELQARIKQPWRSRRPGWFILPSSSSRFLNALPHPSLSTPNLPRRASSSNYSAHLVPTPIRSVLHPFCTPMEGGISGSYIAEVPRLSCVMISHQNCFLANSQFIYQFELQATQWIKCYSVQKTSTPFILQEH